jgi:hypothetical protein
MSSFVGDRLSEWYIAVSGASLTNDGLYADCIRAAVVSANLKNTRLVPNLIYDGEENQFIDEIRSFGVNVIWHKTTTDKPNDPHFIRVASGAFLRIDIPILEKDDEFRSVH